MVGVSATLPTNKNLVSNSFPFLILRHPMEDATISLLWHSLSLFTALVVFVQRAERKKTNPKKKKKMF